MYVSIPHYFSFQSDERKCWCKEQDTDNICIINLVCQDPNFEFLSSWNMSDYYDSPLPDVAVTEMTDERLLSLGFPVAPGGTSSAPSSVLDRPGPGGSVINNPFFTFVSRKYSLLSSPTSTRPS